MTLSRRALVVIFPVVLLSYTLAASAVYIAQNSAILRLEQSRLQQQVANLGVILRADVAVNRGLIATFLSGNALRRFLKETDANYRASGLEVQLRESSRLLLENPRTFFSVAVLPSATRIDYYYENSDDPFAAATEAQLAAARRVLAEGKISAWDFVDRDSERPLIVHSAVIDPVIMRAPKGEWWGGTKTDLIVVQVAIRPDRFIDFKRQIEREYGATLEIASTRLPPLEGGTLSVSEELSPGVFARIQASASYVAGLTHSTRLALSAGVLVISLLSVGLLMALIQRFITRPVAQLDRELTEVMAKRREELSPSYGQGEVDRLSANMKQLHDDLRQSIRGIEQASLTDHLTGIGNRLAFAAAASRAIDSALDSGSHCIMMFLDIDNFKFVNDRYGHEAGDELLRRLARRVEEMLSHISAPHSGAETSFARLSGDEFAILLLPPASAQLAKEVTDGVLSLFCDGFDVDGERYPVSASVGVASYPDDALSLAELMSNADAAMYQAKAGGKNMVAFFSAAISDTRRRARAVQAELRRLDPANEFRLVYMPLVDAKGQVTGCEALLRWTSPLLGPVGPDEFIPIAERNGQFAKIDRWVIDRALTDYAQLRDWFGPDFVLSINISSAELHTSQIAGYLTTCLAKHRVPAASVEIELTETFAAGLGDTTQRGVAALRASGLRIAIDDFGAGYTSVQQITEYAADTIKLDRALVTRLATEDASQTLAALIALCHAQGMAVVGEGVDTEEKRRLLESAGCDLFQGYGICKPSSLEDLGVWWLRSMANLVPEHQSRAATLRLLTAG